MLFSLTATRPHTSATGYGAGPPPSREAQGRKRRFNENADAPFLVCPHFFYCSVAVALRFMACCSSCHAANSRLPSSLSKYACISGNKLRARASSSWSGIQHLCAPIHRRTVPYMISFFSGAPMRGRYINIGAYTLTSTFLPHRFFPVPSPFWLCYTADN